MNNKQFALLVVGILCVCSIAFASVFQDKPMRKLSNGTYVVNTTTLAPVSKANTAQNISFLFIIYTQVRDKKRLVKVGNLVKNSYLYR